MTEMKTRVAVITGAAGEIPSEVARIFADQGTRLILSDINDSALKDLSEELKPITSVVTVHQDVSSPEDADHLAIRCHEAYGALDCLVIGAGLYEHIPIAELDSSRWRRSLAINLDGAFHTIQALRPLLSDGSAIVNIASLAGHRGSINHTSYATAKGGMLALTRSLAQELAPKTRVNAVSPGLIDTHMMKSLDTDKRQSMIASTPLQRLGTVREVADVIVFLCSMRAKYVTGETIHVNGGLYTSS